MEYCMHCGQAEEARPWAALVILLQPFNQYEKSFHTAQVYLQKNASK